MEDIIAYGIGIFLASLVCLFLAVCVKAYRRRAKHEAERLAEQKRASEEYWLNQRLERERKVKEVNSKPISKVQPVSPVVPVRPDLPKKQPTHVPTPTQSVQSYQPTSDDRSMTDVLGTIADVAIIANTVRHWNDNERSVGVTTTTREESTSSWGLDDSDSRKSSSSSFSSSDSWSSSSSDSSSSGPSSDW